MFSVVVTNDVQLVYNFSSEVSHHLVFKVSHLRRVVLFLGVFFWMREKSRHLKNNYILFSNIKITWNFLPK